MKGICETNRNYFVRQLKKFPLKLNGEGQLTPKPPEKVNSHLVRISATRCPLLLMQFYEAGYDDSEVDEFLLYEETNKCNT